MEIFNKVSKILDLVILSVSLLGMFFVFSIFQPLNSDEIAVYAEKEDQPYKEISLENSPFFLNPPKIKPNFDKIKNKIIITKIDSRPDLLNENLFDAYIQDQDKISIKYDQIVYLELTEQENLRLSQKSNLYFSIRPHQANNVKIRFTVDLNGVNTTLDSYSDEFIVELDFEKNKTDKNKENITRRLSGIKGIDLILTKDRDIHIYKGAQEAIIKQSEDKYMYEAIKGDPLGLKSCSGEWCSSNQWHGITSLSNYPDSIVQIAQIFRSNRSGDIIVTAENGYDLRTFEVPEHRASHGSLSREHISVPVIINKKFEITLRRTVDVHALMERYLEAV